MANENMKTLNTRIKLRIDTLENWNKSTLTLLPGEIAFASVAASEGTGLTEPVIMAKIATEEGKTFKELPWAFHAKASDVLNAAKSEAGLTKFIKDVLTAEGVASDSVLQELAGRVGTAEGKIATLEGDLNTAETGLKAKMATAEAAIEALEGLTGGKKVSDAIKEAIDALNLADTYAAKEHGHAISEVDGLEARLQAAKKAGDDAAEALGTYKTTNDAAVKVVSDAVTGIKNGETMNNFKAVEEALAGKQAAGNYSTVGHKHEIADVNGLSDAIADAKAAGTAAAGAAAQALTDAKAYTDSEMTRLVGDTKVATQIENYVNGLDLAETYDAKGAAAAAETAAKGHADGLNTAMDARVQVVEGKAHTHTFVESELNLIKAGDVAKWNAAEQNAKDYADGLGDAMDERVAALEAKFGTGEGNVESQIAAAVAAEAELREAADLALQNQIGVASAEGVTATGLHAKIEAVDAELDRLTGGVVVAEAISAAVKEEADRAKGIEGGLETRLKAVEDDYLKAADKTELEGKIKSNTDAIALLTNGVDEKVVDGVNDLIAYVAEHGTEVTGMKADIKQNADDIDALEGRMEAAEGAIALKAAQADLETLAGRVTTAEGKITTLEGEMDDAQADIIALEELVGDKKVSVAIEEALEAAKADSSSKDAVVLAEAQKGIAAAKTTLEAEIAKKANTADLAAIAKTGSTDDLIQGEMVLIFDCGGAN